MAWARRALSFPPPLNTLFLEHTVRPHTIRVIKHLHAVLSPSSQGGLETYTLRRDAGT